MHCYINLLEIQIMEDKVTKDNHHWPLRGWIGLLLIGVFWYLNWSLSGLRTHWGFFPLWLGYGLTVDALVYYRKGSSLISRNKSRYIGLFLVSAPAWWLFELLNEQTQYWIYTARELFTDLEYFCFATLSFATVMPAVFGTAELAATFKWLQKLGKGPIVGKKNSTIVIFFLSGWVMLALVLLWPSYFAAFLWMSIYFILDPINAWLGNRTLIAQTAHGDWRPVLALWIGCLICGFFWELWNFYSYPKWLYHLEYVDFWFIFEMPILGYLGYLPFALELFALYHLILGFFTKKQTYIKV